MYCPKCGSAINENARFCKSCGYEIATSGQEISEGTHKPITKIVIAAVFAVLAVASLSCLIIFLVIPSLTENASGSSADAPNGKSISSITHDVDYIVHGQWIYTFNDAIAESDAGSPVAVKRTKIDGSRSEVIFVPEEEYTYARMSNLFLANNRLYFQFYGLNRNLSNTQFSYIMSINLNGKDSKKIIDLNGESPRMQLSGDKIYVVKNVFYILCRSMAKTGREYVRLATPIG